MIIVINNTTQLGGIKMRYDVGDKIVINRNNIIHYNEYARKNLDEFDYIYTIESLGKTVYYVSENDYYWSDYEIDHESTRKLHEKERVKMDKNEEILKVWELEEGKKYREATQGREFLEYERKGNELWFRNTINGKNFEYDLPPFKMFKLKFVEIKQFPQIGDEYYVIRLGRGLNLTRYSFDHDAIDRTNIEEGNFFETIEQAEEKLEQIKAILKGETILK